MRRSWRFGWRVVACVELLMLPLALLADEPDNPDETVGYIYYSFTNGQTELVSVPFYGTSDNEATTFFPSVGVTYELYFWDTDLQVWNQYSRTSTKGSYPSRPVLPGEAFFLHANVDCNVMVSGTVPESPMTNEVPDNPSMLAYPFPQAVLWTNTQISSLLQEGSIVSFWSRTSNCWYPAFLKAPAAKGGEWGAAADEFIIPAGFGFAIQQPSATTTNFNWVE